LIASGSSDHFCAHFLRIDDFYHAHCTTTDGVDFALTSRDGRALSWPRKAEQEG